MRPAIDRGYRRAGHLVPGRRWWSFNCKPLSKSAGMRKLDYLIFNCPRDGNLGSARDTEGGEKAHAAATGLRGTTVDPGSID